MALIKEYYIMNNKGYIFGDLNINVNLWLDGESEKGVEFLGYWETNEENTQQ